LWSFDFKDNLAPTLPTKPPFGNGSKSSVAEDVHPSVNVTISSVVVVVSPPPKTEARAVLSFPRPESANEEEEEEEEEEDKAATPNIVPIITDFVAQECVKESV